MAKETNEGVYCAKCNIKMKIGILPKYEYDEGYPLPGVSAYQCPKCNKTFFTEEQVHEMEIRWSLLSEKSFAKTWLSKEEDEAWAHLQKEK